jgi:hypothetical protein
MSTNLQNQKYQTCIFACNICFEACEFCATLCLREDVKMMAKCIRLCHDCATICATASQFMSRDSAYVKKSVTCVLIFVKHVLQNAKNINSIWNIVGCALRRVENVWKNVV